MLEATYIIRYASEEDAEALHNVTQAAYAEYAASGYPSGAASETAREVREWLHTGAFRAVLVEEEGRVIAGVRYRVDTAGLFFFRLSVHPEARGRGIARRLMGELEKIAQLMRADKVRCQVRTHVTRNVALYESAGFVEVETHTVLRGGKEITVATLEKRLPEQDTTQ